jgi:hypothetical protein
MRRRRPTLAAWALPQHIAMNRCLLSLLLLSFVLLCGCAPRYVMQLTNGNEITSRGKPKLKEGAYYFTNASGKPQVVAALRVRSIQPASMAAEDTSQKAPKGIKIKKPKHWYFLWLA